MKKEPEEPVILRKAKETVTDQYDRVHLIEDHDYSLFYETEDKIYVHDEFHHVVGFSRNAFYAEGEAAPNNLSTE